MVPPFLIKAVVKVVLFVVVISGIYVGLSYSGLLPGSFDLLKKKEATFANTALNVEEVKAVAKLFTQKYVNEMAPTLLMYCLNFNMRKRLVDSVIADANI